MDTRIYEISLFAETAFFRSNYQYDASGKENSMIESEEPINFANKHVTGHRCVEPHSLYKVAFSNDTIVTFDPPGYVAHLLDDNIIINAVTSAKSYLLSLDTECTDGHVRLEIELGLDNLPNEMGWEIFDNTKTKIANLTHTTDGLDKYDNQYASSVVFFQMCRKDEAYTIKETDTGGDGLSHQGCYNLFLDNKLSSSSKQVSTLVEIPFIIGTYQPTKQTSRQYAQSHSSAANVWSISTPIHTILLLMGCVYLVLTDH